MTRGCYQAEPNTGLITPQAPALLILFFYSGRSSKKFKWKRRQKKIPGTFTYVTRALPRDTYTNSHDTHNHCGWRSGCLLQRLKREGA